MYKPQASSTAPIQNFDYESHSKELQERFGRLIKQLGVKNTKGSSRYQFEVDFMYALNEIKNCPPYLQGKMFDKASNVVTNLINYLKNRENVAV